MNELTNTGLSMISRTHEDVMKSLFNLTVRPPKKIEITQESSAVYPSVACYTGHSTLEGPSEANTKLRDYSEISERPF